jgi:hypothetical protein
MASIIKGLRMDLQPGSSDLVRNGTLPECDPSPMPKAAEPAVANRRTPRRIRGIHARGVICGASVGPNSRDQGEVLLTATGTVRHLRGALDFLDGYPAGSVKAGAAARWGSLEGPVARARSQ